MKANVYITAKAEKGWHTETQPLTFSPDMDGQEKGLLNLYPDIAFDSWGGFGCALTEASGSVYARVSREQQLRIMLSPRSPPAYMKSNGQRCHSGHLLPEYYARWAEYLCRYIQEFKQRGFLVERMSLQNEAKAVQTWDSCVYTTEEERAFLKILTHALARHSLDHVDVFLWDHNKERAFERTDAILKGETDAAVAGVACHWYSGDHFENLDLLRQRYPQLRLILSESCIEYQFFGREDTGGSACRLAHELIGDMNHGITAFYEWNLLLDETGGPNHVGNYCWAPFLYDRASGQLMPQLLKTFYWHFSHFIPTGALQIALSRYTDQIDATAYRRPDGSLAVVLLNRGQGKLSVTLRLRERIASVALPVGGIVTCEIWDEPLL